MGKCGLAWPECTAVVDFSHKRSRRPAGPGRFGGLAGPHDNHTKAPHHPLGTETTLPAKIKPGENCHAGSRQDQEEHDVRSTHESILTKESAGCQSCW
jgi:hypothetical protein